MKFSFAPLRLCEEILYKALMPVSRQRKIQKARKRPRVPHSTGSATPENSATNRNLRIGAIVVIILVAGLTVGYLVSRRSPQASAEVTTASGLKIQDLRVGDGASPVPGQTVKVNYIGTLENGKEFDNSYTRGVAADFKIGVGRVIKGWDEGLMGMKVGGKRKLYIPSKLGYGQFGKPPDIPPNSNLVFEIELLGIK